MIGAALAGAALGAAAGAAGALWLERRRRRELGRYLAFGAHEVNAPLAAITMTTSNILTGVFGEVPEHLRPWLQTAGEQVSRLAGLTCELRDLVHLELTGAYHAQFEDEPAGDVAAAALRAVRLSYEQAKVPLEVDCPAGLPAITVGGDRAGRLLASLLHHARKLRTDGPVRLRARAEGGFVAFELAFEGPVMTPSEAADSLDVYYPGRQPRQRLMASGFGLGLSKRVLERAGGGLSLEVDGARHRIVARAPVARK